jgi:hypothetical protein
MPTASNGPKPATASTTNVKDAANALVAGDFSSAGCGAAGSATLQSSKVAGFFAFGFARGDPLPF